MQQFLVTILPKILLHCNTIRNKLLSRSLDCIEPKEIFYKDGGTYLEHHIYSWRGDSL
jgi:hypothetical protein